MPDLSEREQQIKEAFNSQGMTEAQAFRWIQKTSMDRRKTMRSVAEDVLAEAEAEKTTAATENGKPSAAAEDKPAGAIKDTGDKPESSAD